MVKISMNRKFTDTPLVKDYLTPYKYRKPIIAPSGIPGQFDRFGVVNAKIFRHNGKIYMFYIGFDGKGYTIYCAVGPTNEHEKEIFGNEYRCLTIAASSSFERTQNEK